MIASCANQNCAVRLHSFSEGRLFQFEVVSVSVSVEDVLTSRLDSGPERQTSQFWLCGSCAATMKLALEPARGLKLVPLDASNSLSEDDVVAGVGMPASNC